MATLTAASHRAPFVDDDPTGRDLNPWHEESGTYDVDDGEEATVIRPVPHLVASTALAVRRPMPLASESLATLSLPHGLHESMLADGARPAGPTQVRIAIVRLARALAVEYRTQHGCALRTDAASIETMQRHLLALGAEVLAGRADPRTLAPQVLRHGVVLGEILVRALGASWMDLSGDQPASWQLVVPPGTIVSPVARVHRFLLQRNREQDLVGFFLELRS